MSNPLFWLGLSILLVAVSLTALLVAAIPALQELARAARSAEKLFDTLSRELPPTLDAIRMTGLELTDLTDDVSESVRAAGDVAKQLDNSLDGARKQAENLQIGTRSLMVGVKTAWRTFTKPNASSRGNINHGHVSREYSEYSNSGAINDGFEEDEQQVSPQLSPAWEIESANHNLERERNNSSYRYTPNYEDEHEDEQQHPSRSLVKDDRE